MGGARQIHDSIAMVPDLEALGIRMLLNEDASAIDRGSALLIYLAGVDDARHFYRRQTISKKRRRGYSPKGYVSVLLSHTPEIYRPRPRTPVSP